jgi:DNA-binding CsgD family transcriptional regulator
MRALNPEILSSVIGDIYDCALNADGWESALIRITQELDGAYTNISLSNPDFTQARMAAQSPWDPAMLNILIEEYGVHGVPGLLALVQGDIDSPVSSIDQIGKEVFFASKFYQNWAKPQGLLDGCMMKFVHTRDRIGLLAFVTYDTRDTVSEDERRFLSVLSPHVRRAALISDLLDFERVQTHAFRGTLEKLQTPIILVTAESKIVYMNVMAQGLINSRSGVQSQQGHLEPVNLKMGGALKDAILRCKGSGIDLGSRGIGIPLSGAGQTASVAYVLPLRNTEVTNTFRSAVAAVFIATNLTSLPPQQTVLATLYDLTPSEARVMSLMASEGANPSATAALLGVSENTIKTHLGRVYSKTGVTRQVELTSLVASLAPPTF